MFKFLASTLHCYAWYLLWVFSPNNQTLPRTRYQPKSHNCSEVRSINNLTNDSWYYLWLWCLLYIIWFSLKFVFNKIHKKYHVRHQVVSTASVGHEETSSIDFWITIISCKCQEFSGFLTQGTKSSVTPFNFFYIFIYFFSSYIST